jgi:glycine hydroxymethyltransferase
MIVPVVTQQKQPIPPHSKLHFHFCVRKLQELRKLNSLIIIMNNINNTHSILIRYLHNLGELPLNPASAAYYASLDHIKSVSPSVAEQIIQEFCDQRQNIKLIASENFCSLATQLAQGNLFTDKYAEGSPHKRFYAGCDNVDAIESEAAQLACELFGAEHAYVQPHSGADANLVAFVAILSARVQAPMLEALDESNLEKVSPNNWNKLREKMNGQRLVAMDYYSGGHLSHGYRRNFSSILFDAHCYSVNPETMLIDLNHLRKFLHEVRPLIFLAGYSAYSRKLNFAKMRELADEVGAVFMVDMSHFSGLVAGKVFTGEFNPVPYAHIVTSTTHKTLRGPRGGLILCKKEFADWVDKGCPAILGGPLPHAMTAKAVAFREALKPEFQVYAHKIVENAQAMAEAFMSSSIPVLTGGTDNHLFLIDVEKTFNLTGRQAESALRGCNITLNRNAIPFDRNGAWFTSGLRIGTPAVTTLSMGTDEMKEIAQIIKLVLENTKPTIIQEGKNTGKHNRAKYQLEPTIATQAKQQVRALLKQYPLYPELDLDLMLSSIDQLSSKNIN